MSSESPPPGVSWHIYVDRRLEDFRIQMDERMRAQQEAVRAYSESNQRAFEKVNEFRQSLQDQNARFATNEALRVTDTRMDGYASRLEALEQARARLEGKATEGASNVQRTMAWLGLGLVILQIVLAIVLRTVFE